MTDTSIQYAGFSLGKWRFNRPNVFAVCITLLLVGICLALGIWQMQRLAWKNALIADLEKAQSEPPLTAADLPENDEALKALNFRKVRLTGIFMDDREFHLIGRYYQGALGYDVLTPFYLADSKRVLLVNRGWIPLEKKDPATRPELLAAGGTVVEGLLLVSQRANPFLPDHDIHGNVWFWYDIARMNAETKLDMPSVVVETVNPHYKESRLPYPRANYAITLRNDHLYYAVTWFSLAFAGILIFFLAHRVKNEKNKV
jgi:surfeit locus 1 family protein